MKRLDGLDVARYFAFVGMVIVNFGVLMGAEGDSGIAAKIFGLLEGRAAATFVVLAGLGLGLAERNGMHQSLNIAVKRGVFLLILGLLNMLIFEADILHYYAIYFFLGVFLVPLKTSLLIALIVEINTVFLVMVFILDYDQGWNWYLYTYDGLWTPSGFLRHLLFNGWHPVFPWLGFLLFGMILSRLCLWKRKTHILLILCGLLALLLANGLAIVLQPWLYSIDAELSHLASTKPIPPMPLYSLAGMGAASVTIGLCLYASELFRHSRLFRAIIPAGRQTLTLYIAHIYIGMSILEMMGMLEGQTANIALSASVIFCVAATIYAFLWSRMFKRGPVEAVMRKLTR